ncbi:MAG: hypothetical protein WCT39_05805 [Candidatus Margulisiibacteriota bacterium]
MKEFFRFRKIHGLVIVISCLWIYVFDFNGVWFDTVIGGFLEAVNDAIFFPGYLLFSLWEHNIWPWLYPDLFAVCQKMLSSGSRGAGLGCLDLYFPGTWAVGIYFGLVTFIVVAWVYVWACLLRFIFTKIRQQRVKSKY